MPGCDGSGRDDLLVVTPAGDIVLGTAEDLRGSVLTGMEARATTVIVDLTRTDYVDSAGIRVLFAIARRLGERRRKLVLVAPPGSGVRRLLEIVDMASCAPICDTLELASRPALRT